MTLKKKRPQQEPLAGLIRPEELFAKANIWIKTYNSNHIEMDWTIDRETAQTLGINCYRIYVHIYGTSKQHDYVIATDRDSVMVFPGQQRKANTVKFVISDNTVNYMHSPIKEESESYYIEALESWDSPKGSGISTMFDIHYLV